MRGDRIVSMRALEAERTSQQTRDMLEQSIRSVEPAAAGDGYCYVWVRDWTDGWVVYDVEAGERAGTYRRTYTIDDSSNDVSLGDAEEVVAKTDYVPAGEVVTESVRIPGRVLESKGAAADGGRIFRVQILQYGDSKNRRRYTESVMRKAAPLYEGAKAFDHHRTAEEMATSTINGLIGTYRNVEATSVALEADLCLLPSATHTAEALDAAVAAADSGLTPLVGISHDVQARFRQTPDRILEAVSIDHVNSADVVADPSAGGQATRVVAGGTEATPPAPTSSEDQMTLEELLALLEGATDEQKKQALAGLGITQDQLDKLAANDPVPPATATTATDAPAEGELVGAATEAKLAKGSALGDMLVAALVKKANLGDDLIPLVVDGLSEHFTEADVTRQVESVRTVADKLGHTQLAPTIPDVRVTGDDRDRRLRRLDAMFDESAREGYLSIKAAYRDIMGVKAGLDDIDARDVVSEAWRGNYDSGRATESMTTASWGEILGDSITRRMIAEYGLPSLQTWRKIVSSIFPVTDFRTQRIERMGGYGTLPTVAQGGPYTALTSPTDEEATYAVSKKGGTEDITWEMVKNDDLRAIRLIPIRLGRAAAQTLYRFVWDILPTNAAVSYDAVALFHASHANTDATAALAQATLSAGRKKMRKQTAYGDTSEVLGDVVVPKYLVVPTDLEEIAFQLCTSAVAVPATPAGPSDTPNIHQGLEPIVVDYYSDVNDWYLVADPAQCPTVEVGFLDGKEEPELFVNNDPTQGATFSNDKVTYKIRHVYGGTVLDHRGFYRASNA